MHDPARPGLASGPPGAERQVVQRTWARIGALFLTAGGVLLYAGAGLARLLALVVLGQGAKAVRIGVELQFGLRPERRRLAGSLVVTGALLVALGVNQAMGA
jgi:hypothetical protein